MLSKTVLIFHKFPFENWHLLAVPEIWRWASRFSLALQVPIDFDVVKFVGLFWNFLTVIAIQGLIGVVTDTFFGVIASFWDQALGLSFQQGAETLFGRFWCIEWFSDKTYRGSAPIDAERRRWPCQGRSEDWGGSSFSEQSVINMFFWFSDKTYNVSQFQDVPDSVFYQYTMSKCRCSAINSIKIKINSDKTGGLSLEGYFNFLFILKRLLCCRKLF